MDDRNCSGTMVGMNRLPKPERLEIFKKICQFNEESGEGFTICAAHHVALGADFEENYRRICLWKGHTGARRQASTDQGKFANLAISKQLYEHDGTILPYCAFICTNCHFKVLKTLFFVSTKYKM